MYSAFASSTLNFFFPLQKHDEVKSESTFVDSAQVLAYVCVSCTAYYVCRVLEQIIMNCYELCRVCVFYKLKK